MYYGLAHASPHGNHSNVHCDTMCPTLMSTPWAPALWIIVIAYVAVVGVSAIVMAKGTRRATYRTALLALQMILCIERALFFTIKVDWSMESLLVLGYAVPICLQFVTFSLLVQFLMQLWLLMKLKAHLIKWLYIGTVIIWLILIAGMSLFYTLCSRGRCEGHSSSGGFDHPISFLSAIVFGTLTVTLGVAGFQLRRLLLKFILSSAMLAELKVVTRLLFLWVIIFAIRTIWSITYSANANDLQIQLNRLQHDDKLNAYYAWTAVFFFFFEVMPSSVLLWTFNHWNQRRILEMNLEANIVNGPPPDERSSLMTSH